MTLPTKATKMKEKTKCVGFYCFLFVFNKHIVKVLESKDSMNPKREVNSRNPEVTEKQGEFHLGLGQET